MKLKEEFRTWLSQTKRRKNGEHLIASTVNAYVSTIDNICTDMKKLRVIDKSLYYVSSKIELDTMAYQIVNNIEYKNKNSKGHNRHSSALDHYIEFIHKTK